MFTLKAFVGCGGVGGVRGREVIPLVEVFHPGYAVTFHLLEIDGK